jgi:hypothetical protein
MATRPKVASGEASAKLDTPELRPLPARTRRNPQARYTAARIKEVEAKARLYSLRARKLEGELLERKVIEADLIHIFSSIKGIVLASPLSMRDKTEILSNLANIPILLEDVAQTQNASPETHLPTQNGRDDAELS